VQYVEGPEDYHEDEEAEGTEGQKEDIKAYLQNLNNRVDTLVDALKIPEKYITAATDERTIREQIQTRNKKAKESLRNEGESISIAQLFNQKL